MNLLQFALLAQHNRLDALSDGFRSNANSARDDVLIGLLILATVGAGVWAATRLLSNRMNEQALDNSWRLFHGLCKAHRLNWSERSLLRRFAAQQGTKDPARIFLEAERWDPSRIPEGVRHEFNRLNVLRRRLFEVPPAEILGSRPAADKLPLTNGRRAAAATSVAKPLAQASVQTLPQPALRTLAASAKQSEVEATARPVGLPLATPRGTSPLLPPMSSPTLDMPPWTANK